MPTQPKSWVMKLEPDPMDRIRQGLKKMELRLNRHKWELMAPGDIIVFKREPHQEDKLEVEIVDVVRFLSFAKLLDKYDAQEYLGRSRERVLERLLKPLGRYEIADEERLGVMGIIIKPLPLQGV